MRKYLHNQPRYFWHYQIGFWFIIGFYLFAGGLTHQSFWMSLVRNIYFPVIGFVTSFVIILLMGKYKILPIANRWVAIILSCILIAALCTIAVNPITFMQSGMTLEEMTLRHFTAGYFNFTLIYMVWGLGYLHIDKSILFVEPSGALEADKRLMLEKNNKFVPVEIADITHIKAAGDYVEVFTSEASYLNRSTLTAFANELAQPAFVQVHRSIIVNLNHLKALSPEAKGEYQIILSNNDTVKVSRTYATSLKEQLKNF